MPESKARKLRGLFVCHVPWSNPYGAANSFRLLLKSIEDRIDIDVVVPMAINPAKMMSVYFSEQNKYCDIANYTYSFYLPWDNGYEGAVTGKLAVRALKIRNVLWRLNKALFNRLIVHNNYDFVYLNSLVLNPIIAGHVPYILHVREVADSSFKNHSFKTKLPSAAIFIDEKTKQPFKRLHSSVASCVLENPVDMTKLKNTKASKESLLQRYGVPADSGTSVFAVMGRVEPVKGIREIIGGFKKASLKNAVLLVVGDSHNDDYLKKCKEASAGNSGVFFIPAVTDTAPVYISADYIVRGDADFRVGRTVLEALYSGCGVIMPSPEPKTVFPESLVSFSDRIVTFSSRDDKSIAKAMCSATKLNLKAGFFKSNLRRYSDEFIRIATEVVKKAE